MRSAQLVLGFADEPEFVSWRFQIHGNALVYVIELSQGADQQRRWNDDPFAVMGTVHCRRHHELVVQTVLARYERSAVSDRHVAAGQCGADQSAQLFRAPGVPPTEVVQDGNVAWIGSYRDAV